MLEKIKENYGKVKVWVGEHKYQVLAGVGIVVAGAVGTALVMSNKNSEVIDVDLDLIDNEPKELDFGRDVMMNFVVDEEGGETLGSVPCTEHFANQMIDSYEEFKEGEKEV